MAKRKITQTTPYSYRLYFFWHQRSWQIFQWGHSEWRHQI